MAAALGIAQSHGAALRVVSDQGAGASFSILFAPSSKVAPVALEPSEQPAADTASRTVLVVDDEAIVRDVAQAMLKSANYNVLIATDGAEAIELFKEDGESIDLVLLDMAMPGLDGRETYEALREIRDDVLVVLSSGYTEEDALSKLGASGLVEFVHKPYKMNTLLAAVRRALGS